MSMAAWQRLTARVSQSSKSFVWPFRAHHSLPVSPHCQSSMSTTGPILFPRLAYPRAEIPENGIPAAIRIPFMQLMAVPKRKVSPSRKGKRNGPKALKPIPVVAKCKIVAFYKYCALRPVSSERFSSEAMPT